MNLKHTEIMNNNIKIDIRTTYISTKKERQIQKSKIPKELKWCFQVPYKLESFFFALTDFKVVEGFHLIHSVVLFCFHQ